MNWPLLLFEDEWTALCHSRPIAVLTFVHVRSPSPSIHTLYQYYRLLFLIARAAASDCATQMWINNMDRNELSASCCSIFLRFSLSLWTVNMPQHAATRMTGGTGTSSTQSVHSKLFDLSPHYWAPLMDRELIQTRSNAFKRVHTTCNHPYHSLR